MSEIAYRWSGILLSIGAALLGVAVIVISLKPVIDQPFSLGVSLLLLISSICLLLSLPAVYARQVSEAGWLGLAGYGLLQTGILILVLVAAPPILYPSLKVTPGENLVFFILGIAFTLGLLLTGIAIVRAQVFPRGAGLLLLAAMAGFFFDFFVAEFLPPMAGQLGSAIFGLLLALSLGWIGFALLMGNSGSSIANVIPAR